MAGLRHGPLSRSSRRGDRIPISPCPSAGRAESRITGRVGLVKNAVPPCCSDRPVPRALSGNDAGNRWLKPSEKTLSHVEGCRCSEMMAPRGAVSGSHARDRLFAVLGVAYLWDSNEEVVGWMERQLAEEEGARSVIDENIKYIRRDHILKQIRSLVQANPEVAMDSIVHMTQHISATQRAEVVRILSTMDAPAST
ncbi:hypothetical protein COCON_G00083530 [Conger conger]|uniref:Uncharacterized protein n=1 Tax=Conger conger TaxID=82655 RepID=A0A9Q1DQV1_CONCO|nr:hypothetical protein COCON_G00083530 [Conger conger]